MSTNIIEMKSGEVPIKIGNNPIFCNNKNRFNYNAVSSENWHEIKVHHKGIYNSKDILDALYRTLHKLKFYPVAYTKTAKYDTFLVRSCVKAMQLLALMGFKINMFDKRSIFISMTFNFAPYEVGQIDPEKKIKNECTKRLQCLEHSSSVENILNLSNFIESQEFEDIIINLNNKHALESVCKTILHREFNHINGLILNSNNIVNIQPLALLSDLNLKMIDLAENNIHDIFLLKHLKWHLRELYITGNPISEKYRENKFLQILPHLIILNGNSVSCRASIESKKQHTDMEHLKDKIVDKLKKNKSEVFETDIDNINELHSIEESINDSQQKISVQHSTEEIINDSQPNKNVQNNIEEIINDSQQKINVQHNIEEIIDDIHQKKSDQNNIEELLNDSRFILTPSSIRSSDKCIEVKKLQSICAIENFEKTIQSCDINDQFNINLFIKTNYLHKVIIHHNNIWDKETILKKLYDLLPNSHFIPISYKSSTKQDTFYLHNCEESLDILCKNKLILFNDAEWKPITLTIKLNKRRCDDSELEPLSMIQKCIHKVYNNNDKYIDLNAFGNKKDFDNFDLGLNHINTLSFILTYITKSCPEVTKIKLSNNNIESCDGLQPLRHLKKLKSLNLNHNKIKCIKDLDLLTGISSINELCLEGNPLNDKVQSTSEYINELKKIFPYLCLLDGEIMTKNDFFLPTKQNYVCDLEAKNFIESFVNYYFKIYDSLQRYHLKEFYHPRAIFSMSSDFGGDKLKKDKQIRCNYYAQYSRNIVRMADFNDSDKSVYIGNTNIIELFNLFPNTAHDLSSFCIDTTAFNSDFACFIIRGHYKDQGSFLNDKEIDLQFTKTFILTPYMKNKGLFGGATEYRIVNEQYHVTSLVTRLRPNRINLKPIAEEETEEELSQKVKMATVAIYNKITELNIPMCKQLLDESNWNFVHALNLFEKYVKEKKITTDSFQ